MLITTIKTEEIKTEIELPAYYQYGANMICVLGEREFIEVEFYSFGYGIKHTTDSKIGSLFFREGYQITKEQFSAKLLEVKEKINQLT